MSLLERIPFSVKFNEAHYRGEVLGNSLQHGVFEVRLTDGQLFHIKAEQDYELRRYSWSAYSNEQFRKLVPIVGKVIERFFARKK
jgi:hypothetical protein